MLLIDYNDKNSVLYNSFLNLPHKHKQPETIAKDVQVGKTWCCLFIGTRCSSVSLTITPWQQWRGWQQCAVSMETDCSLWAVEHHRLIFVRVCVSVYFIYFFLWPVSYQESPSEVHSLFSRGAPGS